LFFWCVIRISFKYYVQQIWIKSFVRPHFRVDSRPPDAPIVFKACRCMRRLKKIVRAFAFPRGFLAAGWTHCFQSMLVHVAAQARFYQVRQGRTWSRSNKSPSSSSSPPTSLSFFCFTVLLLDKRETYKVALYRSTFYFIGQPFTL
jgi:hypothetical protein